MKPCVRAPITLVAALAAALPVTPARAQGTAPPVVRTAAGLVEGVRVAGGVEAWLGLPYAAPPVRELRWRDPQPPAPRRGTFHADRFAPQCIQPQRGPTTNQYSGAEVTSEDCLYLNVWSPPRPSSGQPSGRGKAPVIVYLHGGAFFVGAGSMPLYDGSAVAARGAVFVNLNYRLGLLGFLAHPELSRETPHGTSGNYGLRDQIAALAWVRDNIARFGGDPGNVTIVGQSAGAGSVLALQASPLARGLFHRAVGMSGGSFGLSGTPLRGLAAAERDGTRIAELLKAGSLAELRSLPADRLTLPRGPGTPAIGPIEDGEVLPAPLAAIFAAGRQSDVPLLLGFTRDETLGGFGAVADLADYRAKAAARFGPRAEQFLALYPAAIDAEARAQARLADRDLSVAVPMQDWARAQRATGRAPVYSYLFARPHAYRPGVRFADLDPATAGAYHTSEVPFWLGTLDSLDRFRPTRAWTPADRAFSADLVAALVAFARTGNPDTPALAFPRFDPAAPRLLELGAAARPGDWPAAARLAFWRQSVPPARPEDKVRD